MHPDDDGRFSASIDAILQLQQADPRSAHGKEPGALLAVFEGLRLADCVRVWSPCYKTPEVAHETLEAICIAVVARTDELELLKAPSSIIKPLRRHGCGGGPWRHALDEAFEILDTGIIWLMKVTQLDVAGLRKWAVGKEDVTPLMYPAEFAPAGACDASTLLKAGTPLLKGWRDVTGHYSPLLLPTEEILARLERRGTLLSRFVINLGASDGRCSGGALYDPANCLMLHGNFSGVALEGREDDFLNLAKQFVGRPDVIPRLGFFSPSSAAASAHAAGAPRSPDLLKVDVDNCDVCFVEHMLRLFEPKLIHVEIEAELPPGIIRRHPFIDPRTRDDPPPHGRPGSLGAFLKALRPRYRLLQVEVVNAILVREDLFALVDEGFASAGLGDEERWRLGYFCHPLRSTWRHSPAAQMRRGLQVDTSRLGDPSLPLAVRLRLAKELQSRGGLPPRTRVSVDDHALAAAAMPAG